MHYFQDIENVKDVGISDNFLENLFENKISSTSIEKPIFEPNDINHI